MIWSFRKMSNYWGALVSIYFSDCFLIQFCVQISKFVHQTIFNYANSSDCEHKILYQYLTWVTVTLYHLAISTRVSKCSVLSKEASRILKKRLDETLRNASFKLSLFKREFTKVYKFFWGSFGILIWLQWFNKIANNSCPK